MSLSEILASLRRGCGFTQFEVAAFLGERGKMYSPKSVSSWESGVAMPPLDTFLLLCELYGVRDVLAAFCGLEDEINDDNGMAKLNEIGKKRVEEYIRLLSRDPMFAGALAGDRKDDMQKPGRVIRLYDIPVAAGSGSFLDSDAYVEFEVDETVPEEADFAVTVSGDSMTPRFVDGQIVFVKEQQTLNVGEIGIFGLDGDSYIKKLGPGVLLSLNARYFPIPIYENSSFYVFGKVLG